MSTLLEYIYGTQGVELLFWEIQIINIVLKYLCLYFTSHTAQNLAIELLCSAYIHT